MARTGNGPREERDRRKSTVQGEIEDDGPPRALHRVRAAVGLAGEAELMLGIDSPAAAGRMGALRSVVKN